MFRVLLLAGLFLSTAVGAGLEYAESSAIPVIAAKVGPYFNPTETYPYTHVPFCPTLEDKQSHNLGEILAGERKVLTKYEVLFKVPFDFRRLCKRAIDADQVSLLHQAIDEDWYWELEIDGLRTWGYIGGVDTPTPDYLVKNRHKFQSLEDLRSKRYLNTHLHFAISYNGNRIQSINVTTPLEYRLELPQGKAIQVDFSYQVSWTPTNADPSARVETADWATYLPANSDIHWLSIINSFILVLLLTIFLAMILMRVLKNDFANLVSSAEDKEMLFSGDDEDSGWKLLSGDVFRFPANKTLFCAIIGSGVHLLLLGVCSLTASLLSSGRTERLATIVLVFYALTAGIGGYTAQVLFARMGGKSWVWTTILTATLFPGPLFAVFCILNTIAIYYGSTAALPFGTIVAVFAVYLLVTFPLTVFGAIAGKRGSKPYSPPCRTNKIARAIPESAWYQNLPFLTLIAGFLPFSSIYIELHFIFASVWGHHVYTLFGMLFLAFILLVVVTSFFTVALVFFQLVAENHLWYWRSLLYGGATSIFVYAYSAYYYFEHSAMSGVLQTSYYFGYMFIVSYGFFLVLGTVGFISSYLFVHSIYGALKLD